MISELADVGAQQGTLTQAGVNALVGGQLQQTSSQYTQPQQPQLYQQQPQQYAQPVQPQQLYQQPASPHVASPLQSSASNVGQKDFLRGFKSLVDPVVESMRRYSREAEKNENLSKEFVDSDLVTEARSFVVQYGWLESASAYVPESSIKALRTGYDDRKRIAAEFEKNLRKCPNIPSDPKEHVSSMRVRLNGELDRLKNPQNLPQHLNTESVKKFFADWVPKLEAAVRCEFGNDGTNEANLVNVIREFTAAKKRCFPNPN